MFSFVRIDIVERYSDILQGSTKNNINSHVQFTTIDVHQETANLLLELLNIIDGLDLSLADLSSVEFYDIICFTCTS